MSHCIQSMGTLRKHQERESERERKTGRDREGKTERLGGDVTT